MLSKGSWDPGKRVHNSLPRALGEQVHTGCLRRAPLSWCVLAESSGGQVGQPAYWAGTGTSLASRPSCYLHQTGEPVELLAKLPTPPKGLYRLQPPAARLVAATDVTSVYQTDVTSAAPTDTLCLCSNVSVGPANIKSVWATDVTSVASGRRYRGGL
ncbi:hypothetical protein PCASD_26041 [Puccinia coronata f. sp. avenae]|uniref:Uncharacterized protein n=1 Tax=Puccinia coronata f. sp. avenae TaxID=200324 RepID=A0A2N5TT96_9BASI|nr:hypothetical protein PCASD_26041 [Puccinia coronata f. sp. avenae]